MGAHGGGFDHGSAVGEGCAVKLIDEDGENLAVRVFLMRYGGASTTSTQMAAHMRALGFDVVPDWVGQAPGHLTKGGAQLWLRMLFGLEQPAAPAGGPKLPHPGSPEASAMIDSVLAEPAQETAETWNALQRSLAEIERLRAALSKLVALKDMKDRLRKLHVMGHGTDYGEYHRLKSIAWEAARAELNAATGVKPWGR